MTEVRLVEWNIAMAVHKKSLALSTLAPDVAILPECADLPSSLPVMQRIGASDGAWVGSLPHKGLAVFTFGDWHLEVDSSYDPGFPWLLPLHVHGPEHLRLLAVWEMNRRGQGYAASRSVGSVRASLEHYRGFLTGSADSVLISGDFNASTVWDRPGGGRRFVDLVAELESLGLVSAYHRFRDCGLGDEPEPTHWWRRDPSRTYHIDYTFLSTPDSLTEVTVGGYEEWLGHSDHAPMTVTLNLPGSFVGRAVRSGGRSNEPSVSRLPHQ